MSIYYTRWFKEFLSTVILTVLLCGMPAFSFAQAAVTWEAASGPFGGQFEVLSSDPFSGWLWAATHVGHRRYDVYYSDDLGSSWGKASRNVAPFSDFSFRADGLIMAGAQVSDDGGASWELLNIPADLSIKHHAIDRATGNLIITTNKGQYYSENDGVTWTLGSISASGRGFKYPDYEALWAVNDSLLFAQLDLWDSESLLIRSDDGGQHWEELTSPVFYLADLVGNSDGKIYIVGWVIGGNGNALYYSEDSGTTWTLHSKATCPARNIAAALPDNKLLMFGRSVFTVDLETKRCDIVFAESSREFRYAGYYRHETSSARQVSVDERLGRVFLYTEFGELWLSEDGANSWEKRNVDTLTGTSVSSIAVADRVWVGTTEEGLFSVDKGGAEWRFEGFDGGIWDLQRGAGKNEVWLSSVAEGLHRSVDGGVHWDALHEKDLEEDTPGELWGPVWRAVYDPVSEIYYANFYNEIKYTVDAGNHWQNMSFPVSDPYVFLIDVAVGLDGYLYIRYHHDRGNWLSRTNDLGATWELMYFDETYSRDWEYSLYDGDGGLWISEWNVLRYSTNQGRSPVEKAEFERGINALIETPDGSIWVGHELGLARSADKGKTWIDESAGIEMAVVLSLAFDPSTNALYVGTEGKGLFTGYLDLPAAVDAEQEISEEKEVKMTSYPNPTFSRTTVEFSIAHPKQVTLAVYDVLGRRVEQLINHSLPAGKHTHTIDFMAHPPGTYFLRLNAGGEQQTRSVLYLK